LREWDGYHSTTIALAESTRGFALLFRRRGFGVGANVVE
jgi:hypothetical protein